MNIVPNFAYKYQLKHSVSAWNDWVRFCKHGKHDPLTTKRFGVDKEFGWNVPGGRRIPEPIRAFDSESDMEDGTYMYLRLRAINSVAWKARITVKDRIIIKVK